MNTIHPLISALRLALTTGSASDLQRASEMGTDINLQGVRELIFERYSEAQVEMYDVVTDALLAVRLMLRAPMSIQELLASPEVWGLRMDLDNAFSETESVGTFLYSSGQRQTERLHQRQAYGLH